MSHLIIIDNLKEISDHNGSFKKSPSMTSARSSLETDALSFSIRDMSLLHSSNFKLI